jgi:ankyrin repeat protein
MAATAQRTLHQKILHHNWDGAHAPLWAAVRSPETDLATALYIYWAGGAAFYQRWRSVDEAPGHAREGFELVVDVERRVVSGFYRSRSIRLHPRELGRGYEESAHTFVRELPPVMYEAVDPVPSRRLQAAAAAGDAASVRTLLVSRPDLEERDDDGLTALHHAACAGSVEVARALIDGGAKVDATISEQAGTTCLTPLAMAVVHGHGAVVEVLVRAGAAPEPGFFPPLELAIRARNVEGARVLLASGARVELREMTLAASMRSLPVLELIASSVKDIDVRRDNGLTALLAASACGWAEGIAFLHARGARLDILGDEFGIHPTSALHLAAKADGAEAVEWLLAHGMLVNGPPEAEETPLVAAAGEGATGAARVLLAHGADDLDRAAAATMGHDRIHLKTLAVLLEAGASATLALQRAAAHASWDACELALEHRPDLAALAPRNTALHASCRGSPRAARHRIGARLLALGAPVNARDEHGRTPLHDAASSGLNDLASLLIDAGADVNARTERPSVIPGGHEAPAGSTPLDLAILTERLSQQRARGFEARGEVIDILKKAGATPLTS